MLHKVIGIIYKPLPSRQSTMIKSPPLKKDDEQMFELELVLKQQRALIPRNEMVERLNGTMEAKTSNQTRSKDNSPTSHLHYAIQNSLASALDSFGGR
jgi:hypothetical protein